MDVKRHHVAKSLEDAYRVWLEDGQNAFLGGGLWLKKMGTPVATLIDLGQLGLDQIDVTPKEIIIGALTPLREIEEHPDVRSLGNGFLSKSIEAIMGVGLRNLATIGGSIAGKYPFSDVVTALLTLKVTLTFYPKETITLQDFVEVRGKTDKILTHITIEKEQLRGHFKKIANTPLDFAMLNLAIVYKPKDIRISVGSRPAIAKLATKASEYLNSLTTIEAVHIEQAAKLIFEQLNFATTSAASNEYRSTLATAYVKRGLREVLGYDR